MARRRNPYRPGTESYARWRQAGLARRAALAQATAARAKKPEARRRAKRRASAAKRGLREISARQDYRSGLNERDRDAFNHLSIEQQNQLMRVLLGYSEAVPLDLPDPFVGRRRNELWRLYYATRAGIRQRQAA